MVATSSADFPEPTDPDRAHCDFCGLPLTHGVSADAAGHCYCCYGCRFAASLADGSGDEAQARWTMTRLGLAVFFSMNVMVCTLLLWSEDASSAEGMPAAWYDLFRYASVLFSAPVVFLLAPPIIEDAWRELSAGRASMSVLLVIGMVAALGYSAWSVLFGGHIYSEVACAILLGVTLGKWLEANGKLQTTAVLRALSKFLPETVRIVRDGVEVSAPAGELSAGDSFRVLPSERIVADGRVARGEALVDEQAVTGESVPITKMAGSAVYSGTLLVDAPLLITASSPAGQGTMARLIAAVKRGAESKTAYERLAERISRWFLPAVILIAAGTFLLHGRRGEWEHGLLAAVAVLVIACPCSLGLATPMALWAAISRAAEEGILVRSGDALTQFAAVRTIAFDKTGTLTTGKPRLADVHLAEHVDLVEIAAIVRSLVADSSHPLAAALRDADICSRSEPTELQLHELQLEQVRHIPGRGVTAIQPIHRYAIWLGNRRWLQAEGQDCSQFPEVDDVAETFIAWNGEARGRFIFTEELRPGLAATLMTLRQDGLKALMLTGDRQPRAEALASSLGMEYRAELLPEEKLSWLQNVPAAEHPLAMIGDGVNDAPALAAVDVGISLASGAEIARNSAAICLLRNDLDSLPFLRRLARRTVQALHWNLTWAFLYNVIGLALAAAGWLHPVIAAVAMGISGLFVVLNSLSLARFESATSMSDSNVGPSSLIQNRAVLPEGVR